MFSLCVSNMSARQFKICLCLHMYFPWLKLIFKDEWLCFTEWTSWIFTKPLILYFWSWNNTRNGSHYKLILLHAFSHNSFQLTFLSQCFPTSSFFSEPLLLPISSATHCTFFTIVPVFVLPCAKWIYLSLCQDSLKIQHLNQCLN